MAPDNINFLKNVSLFSPLSEMELKEIGAIVTEKSYQKGEIIFHQGDPGSVLFILKSGAVKISLVDQNAREVILKMLYENDFFGEMSLLDGRFRSATITALEKTRAIKINRNDFIQLINKHAAIVLNMLAALSQRLRKADEKIASLSFFNSYGRVARVLLDLMERNIEEKSLPPFTLDISMSRQELANMAGISRETFARILKEFEIRGCLKVDRKKLVILDEIILRKEAV